MQNASRLSAKCRAAIRTHLALDGGGEVGRVGHAAAELQQRLRELAVPDAEELRARTSTLCIHMFMFCFPVILSFSALLGIQYNYKLQYINIDYKLLQL